MKESEKTPRKKKSVRGGKIAGQGTRKDSATTLLFKTSRENFAELFNRTLLAGEPVSPDELDEADIKETAYLSVKKEGGRTSLVQYRDVVMRARKGRRLAVLGIENQALVDYAMPFRVLELDFVNYARQMQVIRERHEAEWRTQSGGRRRPEGITDGEYLGRFLKTDRMIRCLTLVVYWGEEPWDGPKRLSDLFEEEEEAAGTVRLDMRLVDVCRLSDEEIGRYTGELKTVFGFRKYAENKEKLREFIDGNREHFSNVSETALNVLEEITHSPELKQIRGAEYQTPEGGFDMCRGIQGMIQDGRKEGMQEGIREGELKKAREMSLSMADMGIPVEKIAGAARVSVELVREWLSGKSGEAGGPRRENGGAAAPPF